MDLNIIFVVLSDKHIFLNLDFLLVRNFEEDPEQAIRRPTKEELTVLGTTVDIVAFREQDQVEGFHHGPVFIVKFLGRQRFKLLECHRKFNG